MNDSMISKIEELILATNEPKDKALLLIQLEMVKSLIENTTLTKDLHEEFKEHAKEEMALIIKGRFLWRLLLGFALVLQVGLGWMFNRHVAAFDSLQREVEVLRLFQSTHTEHHRMEEAFKGGPKVDK